MTATTTAVASSTTETTNTFTSTSCPRRAMPGPPARPGWPGAHMVARRPWPCGSFCLPGCGVPCAMVASRAAGQPVRTKRRTRMRRRSEVQRLQHGLALAEHPRDQRQLLAGGQVPRAGRLEGLAADDLAAAHQRHQQRPVVAVVGGSGADADHLGLRDATLAEPPQRVLPAADRHLVLALLRHRHHLAVRALAGDQLVDEAAGR